MSLTWHSIAYVIRASMYKRSCDIFFFSILRAQIKFELSGNILPFLFFILPPPSTYLKLDQIRTIVSDQMFRSPKAQLGLEFKFLNKLAPTPLFSPSFHLMFTPSEKFKCLATLTPLVLDKSRITLYSFRIFNPICLNNFLFRTHSHHYDV